MLIAFDCSSGCVAFGLSGETSLDVVDITGSIELARRASSGWDSRRAHSVAQQIRAVLSGVFVDWDEGAGERWMTLVQEGRSLLTLSTVVPFAFVHSTLPGSVMDVLNSIGVVGVFVDGWTIPQFSVRAELTRQVFGFDLWEPPFDPVRFSAQDLWFQTI